MLKFKHMKPVMLDKIVSIEQHNNLTLDEDFDVMVANEQCWSQEDFCLLLSSRDVKGIYLEDSRGIIGGLIYRVAPTQYEVLWHGINFQHPTFQVFLPTMLEYMVEMTVHCGKAAFTIDVRDSFEKERNELVKLGLKPKLLRDYIKPGVDAWELTWTAPKQVYCG